MNRKKASTRFITFEGGEGVGKSTQVTHLSNLLNKIDIQHIVTREPGGSPGAEVLRKLLVEGEPSRWDAVTETLLHFAARRDHLVNTIKPALENKNWVLCDRYVDSTFAYQGYGHGVPLEGVGEVYKLINIKLRPDLTFILDLPVADGLTRTISRTSASGKNTGENRYEKMEIEFHERLREGFLEIARTEPLRCVVLDAARAPHSIFEDIKRIIYERYLHNEEEA